MKRYIILQRYKENFAKKMGFRSYIEYYENRIKKITESEAEKNLRRLQKQKEKYKIREKIEEEKRLKKREYRIKKDEEAKRRKEDRRLKREERKIRKIEERRKHKSDIIISKEIDKIKECINIKILDRTHAAHKCYRCEKEISLRMSGRHHIIPRRFGGSDDDYNRISLCGMCHDYVEIKTEEWIKSGKYYDVGILKSMIRNDGFN